MTHFVGDAQNLNSISSSKSFKAIKFISYSRSKPLVTSTFSRSFYGFFDSDFRLENYRYKIYRKWKRSWIFYDVCKMINHLCFFSSKKGFQFCPIRDENENLQSKKLKTFLTSSISELEQYETRFCLISESTVCHFCPKSGEPFSDSPVWPRTWCRS